MVKISLNRQLILASIAWMFVHVSFAQEAVVLETLIEERDYSSLREVATSETVNTPGPSGKDSLTFAVDNSDVIATLILLRAGADSSVFQFNEDTDLDSLDQSARRDSVWAIKSATVDGTLTDALRSIQEVILANDWPEFLGKVARNADIHNPDANKGWTPLHCAALVGSARMTRVLLALGAAPDPEDAGKQTPLHFCVALYEPEVAELLLSAGADANAAVRGNGLRPIHFAALSGNAPVVELLIAKGADISAVDARGWTVLHICALKGHRDLAEYFLSQGAVGSLPEIRGLTPPMIAAGLGYTELAAILGASTGPVAEPLPRE